MNFPRSAEAATQTLIQNLSLPLSSLTRMIPTSLKLEWKLPLKTLTMIIFSSKAVGGSATGVSGPHVSVTVVETEYASIIGKVIFA